MSKNIKPNLSTILAAFKRATVSTETARVKASSLALAYVTEGGKQSDLAAKSGVLPGTVSKYVTAGKALALVPDADAETVKKITRSVFEGQGDRKALVEAIKSEDAAGVVAAASATKENTKKKTDTKGSGNKGNNVTLQDMSTEALLDLLTDAVEVVASRDDLRGANADRFAKIGKAVTLIAKNVTAIPVTV